MLHIAPKRRGHATWETPGSVRRQKECGETVRKSLFYGIHQKEGVRQGKQIYPEYFQWALGDRECPELAGTQPWGD